jgi:hypothetical protein
MSIKKGVIRGKGTQIEYIRVYERRGKPSENCTVAYAPVVGLLLTATFVIRSYTFTCIVMEQENSY